MQRNPPAENVVTLETEPERLWREFLEARERAWNSLDLSDGIASGRAYAAFLEVFVAPNLRTRAARGRA
jgi:hypothetical protein